MRARLLVLLLFTAWLLGGCAAEPDAQRVCRVVLEHSGAFDADEWSTETVPGGSVSFVLTPHAGWRLIGTGAAGACLTMSEDGSTVLLTLPGVRYSTAVAVQAVRSGRAIEYESNGADAAPVTVYDNGKHLRINTAAALFIRDGYTQVGWSVSPEGEGPVISQGSRVDAAEEGQLTLYAVWAEWAPEDDFSWERQDSGAVITGYTGQDRQLVIPGKLGGVPVMSIAQGAFAGAACGQIVLPDTLRSIDNGAFAGCAVSEIVMFDSLQMVHDGAFDNCDSLQTLRIQAACAPVYSGTYYSTFADKMDRLLAMRDMRKIVLFSGSSTRFGYDSAALDAAFPDYGVVNMGVFAYTNAVPQLLLILDCMQTGDILLDSPELDAAKRQFCTTNVLDAAFFRMLEADYDLLARLDLREVQGVFSAYHEYRVGRGDLPARSHQLSAADYDEDGTPVPTPSYNKYGDYCLYRPDAEEDAPVYGLAVPYTKAAYPQAQYIDPYNEMCRRFLDKGVQVYFTWSPRNREALSAESTPEARAELEAYLRETLIVPMLLPLEESLVPGRLLYGTDNHLSTNGCAQRTARVIAALKEAMGGSE